jgi:uncharacterized protein
MRPTPLILAALLAVSLLAPAQAQSKKESINKILAIQKPQYEQFGMVMAQSPVQPLLQQAAQVLRARVPEDKREAVGKAMDAEVQAYMKDVGPPLRASAVKAANEVIAAKLESSFNEAELKQLVQYLESPIIKRYNQLGPELQTTIGQRVGTEHRALVETKAKNLDTKLAELLGLKPGVGAAPAAASKP